MHSTSYILKFVLIMTVIVAFILAGMNIFLKPIHELNEAVYEKKSILIAVEDQLDQQVENMTNQEVQGLFESRIKGIVVDAQGNKIEGVQAAEIVLEDEMDKPKDEQHYPVFVFTKDDSSQIYILSVRGQGLWDAIWGSIALKEDLRTIAGVSFDHKGETPGLGAEIKDNPAFPAQFEGKVIYDDQGNYTSIQVVKGIIREPAHQVQSISGATITSRGVEEMMYSGLKKYEPYFETVKN